MKKIDLSKENVMKTQMFTDQHLFVKNYKPKYNKIECIESYKDGTGIRFYHGIIKWESFKKHFGDRRILSVHDYDDTKSTSICLERVVS